MPENKRTAIPAPDLFSLALAPMSARVNALEQAWTLPEESGSLPSRSVQIAGLIVAETVRLIRLGDRSELADSALELAQLVARAEADAVAAIHPESHRLASGAALVLGAASAPSSGGGEMAVLRSWNGKAREAVELLSQAHDKALTRIELRSALGGPTESHLSHLLADLEASGLAVRIREGKTVTVHLGPNGRSEEVQERLAPRQPPSLKHWGPMRDLDVVGAGFAYATHHLITLGSTGATAMDTGTLVGSLDQRRSLPLWHEIQRFSTGDELRKSRRSAIDAPFGDIASEFRDYLGELDEEEGEGLEETIAENALVGLGASGE
jgi:hypothetical protein